MNMKQLRVWSLRGSLSLVFWHVKVPYRRYWWADVDANLTQIDEIA